jgi:thiol peroxidase
VVVLTLSKDLPFALERFCAAEGIDRIYTLSDYRESEFGMNYGFLIKENKLLTRGVVVIGKDGKITYVQYVKDISQEPDYKAAIAAVKKAK